MVKNRFYWRGVLSIFWLVLNGGELMGQERFPAVDEFSGMYNSYSLFGSGGLSEFSEDNFEVLANSEQAKKTLTADEVKTIGDAVTEYERTAAMLMRESGVLTPDYQPGTYFVPGDRTIHMLPGHYSMVNAKFCADLCSMLCDRFPLWRVMVCVEGTSELPMVYPECVVIPSSWKGREEQYWSFLQQRGKQAFEDAAERLAELEGKIALEQLKDTNLVGVKEDGIDYRILCVFERKALSSGGTDINVWVQTDNKFPGVSYRPKARSKGFWGSQSVYGIDSAGLVCKHGFGNFEDQDKKFQSRIYSFSYEGNFFEGKIELRSPVTGEDFEAVVPKKTALWRQIDGSQRFERVWK